MGWIESRFLTVVRCIENQTLNACKCRVNTKMNWVGILAEHQFGGYAWLNRLNHSTNSVNNLIEQFFNHI